MIRAMIAILLTCSALLAQDVVGVDQEDSSLPTTQASTRPSRRVDRNPPNVNDILEHVDSADDFSRGETKNVNVVADGVARIQLGYRQSMFPREGTWTGPEVKTKFAFTELIPSFNPYTPPDCGATLEVRVRQGGEWSPWLFMQSWGKVVFPPKRTVDFAGGEVDIDELILKQPADAYQVRITLNSFGFEIKSAPSVRRVSVCYSGVVADSVKRAKLKPPTTLPANWARDLQVPFRGQGAEDNPKSIHGMICSPTSASMVMEFMGVNCTTVEHAMAIYDPQYDLFGNWGRSISRAAEMGFDGWLARFRSWDDVKPLIADGVPVIASIRFREGQVKGFLYESTPGHLLVVRGFTSSGDIIVNDPASRAKGGGAIYPAAEFAKAWFDNGGVGYVIRKPSTPLPADLMKGPPSTSPAKPLTTAER